MKGRLRAGRSPPGPAAANASTHGDLVCCSASDMAAVNDIDRFKDHIVRVRTATEPLLAY